MPSAKKRGEIFRSEKKKNYGDYKILNKNTVNLHYYVLFYTRLHLWCLVFSVLALTAIFCLKFYNPRSFSKLPKNYGDYKIQSTVVPYLYRRQMACKLCASLVPYGQKMTNWGGEFCNPHSFSAVLRNYGDYKLNQRLYPIYIGGTWCVNYVPVWSHMGKK